MPTVHICAEWLAGGWGSTPGLRRSCAALLEALWAPSPEPRAHSSQTFPGPVYWSAQPISNGHAHKKHYSNPLQKSFCPFTHMQTYIQLYTLQMSLGMSRRTRTQSWSPPWRRKESGMKEVRRDTCLLDWATSIFLSSISMAWGHG